MREVLNRYVTSNLESLQDAAENGDIEVAKNVLSIIPQFFGTYNDEIKKGLARSYSAAVDEGHYKTAELILETINEQNGDQHYVKREETTENEKEVKGLLRAFGSMAGSAGKYVVEKNRDEAAEEFKENAKEVGNSLKNLGQQTKKAISAIASKEDLSKASEKVSQKVKKITADIRERIQEQPEEDFDGKESEEITEDSDEEKVENESTDAETAINDCKEEKENIGRIKIKGIIR